MKGEGAELAKTTGRAAFGAGGTAQGLRFFEVGAGGLDPAWACAMAPSQLTAAAEFTTSPAARKRSTLSPISATARG